MRLLIWTQYFWPESFHINEVAHGLREQGAEVTVLTGKPNYPDGAIFAGYRASGVQRQHHDGYTVVRVPLRARGKGSASGLALNYISFVLSGYLFAPIALRKQPFDLVFVYAPSPLIQTLPAIFVAWLKGAPLVLWVQDIWPDALQATGFVKSDRMLRLVARLMRAIYRHCDLILIQSEGFRDAVERLVDDRSKVRFFPNSSAAMPAQPAADQTTQAICDRIGAAFSVVFAGNIGTVQSCETIVEAADLLRENPKIRFFLVGSGSMARPLADDIAARGLDNIEMPGRVAADQIPAIYAAASVLLLTFQPGSMLSATIPSKLQGYLAAGKPVIVSSDGEPAKVLDSAAAGPVCAPGDPQALADAVVQLADMGPLQRDELGNNGRRYFMANFHLPDRVSELLAIFRDQVQRQ